jgi:hypothetical protein
MLVEYYLASRLGRVWLRLHPGLKVRIGDGPDLCLTAAKDRQIQPAQLWRAQEFAVRIWWRAGMAAVMLTLPVIGLSAAVRPGPVGTDVGVGVILGLGCLAAVAMLQMLVIRLRADQTRRYLLRGGSKPLDAYEGGYPTRFDFWAAAAVALIMVAILGYAGLRSR